jgi:hypothetical protein
MRSWRCSRERVPEQRAVGDARKRQCSRLPRAALARSLLQSAYGERRLMAKGRCARRSTRGVVTDSYDVMTAAQSGPNSPVFLARKLEACQCQRQLAYPGLSDSATRGEP